MSLTKVPVESLLELCLQKNNLAQLEVYNRYQKAMFNTSVRIVKNSALAEDIMQESFLTAFNRLDTFKGTATFGSWLKRIVVNNSISAYHKSSKYVPLDQFEHNEETYEDEDGIAEISNENPKANNLLKVMKTLHHNYDQVLTLHYIEGFDYEEICEILNITNANCRTMISRAKESLRKKMNLK